MATQLRFTISPRQPSQEPPVDLVNTVESNHYYTEKLIIETTAQGFQLVLPEGNVLLKNNDTIVTRQHKITLELSAKPDINIGFYNHRAPIQTLSDQWKQAGLNTFMDTQLEADHAVLPLTQTYCTSDPLDFLNAPNHNTPKANVAMPSLNNQPTPTLNWLPSAPHYFEPHARLSPTFEETPTDVYPMLSSQHPFEQAAAPVTEPPTTIQASTDTNKHAPIDDIDILYAQHLGEFDNPSGQSSEAYVGTGTPRASKGGQLLKKIKKISPL